MEKETIETKGVVDCQESKNSRPPFKNKKLSKKSFKREALIFNFVCMLIPVVQWLIFWLYVNMQTIMLAFKNPYNNEFDLTINFEYLWRFHLSGVADLPSKYNASLLLGFKNTMLFFGINVFVTLPMSIVIAYFIYKKIAGYKFFRIVFYLPAVLPAIVLTTVYKQITENNGILDMIFHNVPDVGLLNSQDTALGALVVFVILCSFTTNVLLFSGGMARVPMEVIEAAKLDGCTPFQEIIFLIVPLIWPTLTTQIILAFTNMFNGGGPVLLLTEGNKGTMTISYWLFFQIAGNGKSALGADGAGVYRVSAVGLALTAIAVPVILLVRKMFDKVEPVEY